VIERDVRDSEYLTYFKAIALKQADPLLKKSIENNIELFATLAYAGGGNPRMILKTLQDTQKLNTSNTDQVIKDFYRSQIWTEHTSLGEKYKGHKALIDWGRDFIEKVVIPNLQAYNDTRKQKLTNESSIYFWIHKDAPETVKEALRLLTYTGIIRKTDATIRATRSELGARYEVKYGCLLSLYANPHSESKEFLQSLSVKKYVEYGKSNSAYVSISELASAIEDDVKFQESVQDMMRKPISVLAMLSKWQIERLQQSNISSVEDLYRKTEADLIEEIYGVGPARARIIKNAVSAELLEYLSG
jgi:DNA-binding Lrp family transcriptional regulator